jgi:hypothetical protein
MDANAILQQSLGPMLEGIAAYGRQLADQRRLADERQYRRSVVSEERQYAQSVRDDERTYQERRDAKRNEREDTVYSRARADAKSDDQDKHRRELVRNITAAFPGDNVAGMSDAALEARSIEAKRKLAADDVSAKSEAEIRGDARRMGIADAEKGDIAAVRKAVIDKRSQEAADLERTRIAQADQIQEDRLGEPGGKSALEAYNSLAQQKAAVLREFAISTMQENAVEDPERKRRVGAKTVALLATTDPELYQKLVGNPKLNQGVLERIKNGEMPAPGSVDAEQSGILLSVNQQADAEVMKEDLASGRLDAMRSRGDSFEKKAILDARLRDIDDKISGLTQAYPALRKRPYIDKDVLIGAKVATGSGLPGLPKPSAALSQPASSPVPDKPSAASGFGDSPMRVIAPAPAGLNAPPSQAVSPDGFWSGGGPMSSMPTVDVNNLVPLDTMSQYRSRARELTAGPRGSFDPLQLPMDDRIAMLTGIAPQQVGLSRFSVTPAEVVSRNRDAIYDQFSKLPPAVQEKAVIDAISASYNDPTRRRPLFGWQYD